MSGARARVSGISSRLRYLPNIQCRPRCRERYNSPDICKRERYTGYLEL
jgi:hypothetical protein